MKHRTHKIVWCPECYNMKCYRQKCTFCNGVGAVYKTKTGYIKIKPHSIKDL